MIDGKLFFQHYNIDYATSGNKHCRHGWIQIHCPFCFGSQNYHLGHNIQYGTWNCWRCGSHSTYDVLFALLGSRVKAREAQDTFKLRPQGLSKRFKQEKRTLTLPDGLQPLTWRARAYLEERKFDPDLIENTWSIQSTSVHGNLKHRIFIPFYEDGNMVTWQCRDILGNSKIKYIAASEQEEITSVKNMVYGADVNKSRKCVVVEGVTDVWRLGVGAIALCGIKFTSRQVQLLFDLYDEFHILFDSDKQAIVQADKLAKELRSMGKSVEVWQGIESDPADMNDADAQEFMKQALGKSGY